MRTTTEKLEFVGTNWDEKLDLQAVGAAEELFEAGEFGLPPARCLVGFELEYMLEDALECKSDDEVRQQYGRDRASILSTRERFVAQAKQQAWEEVSTLVPANRDETDRQQDWLGQVESLTLEELVMFRAHAALSRPSLDYKSKRLQELLEADDTEQDTIEYRFGKGKYQEGYYDNIPEVRTIPATPVVALRRRQRVIDTFSALAQEYGLDVQFRGNHTNFSVWVRDENGGYKTAHDLSTEAGLAISRTTAAGILTTFRDTVPMITTPDALIEQTGIHAFAVGHGRVKLFRVLPNRFELRYGSSAHERADITVLTLMGGFIHGMQSPKIDDQVQIVEVPYFRPAEGYDKVGDLHILRALEHGKIIENGLLQPNPIYTRARSGQIVRALTGSEEWGMASAASVAMSLQSTIRLVDGTLTCDKQALDGWRQDNPEEFALLAKEGANLDPAYITERLKVVAFAGMGYAIEGEVGRDKIAPLTWHALLGRCAVSRILEPTLPQAMVSDVVARRAEWFNPEDATQEAIELLTDVVLGDLIQPAARSGNAATIARNKQWFEEGIRDISRSSVLSRERIVQIQQQCLRRKRSEFENSWDRTCGVELTDYDVLEDWLADL